MTESPRPRSKIPSILKKSAAKNDDLLVPSDTPDSQGSPIPGKSQENELSDDITVHGLGKSSAIKKFNKAGNKNLLVKDNSAGIKKSTLNGLNAKEFKAAKKTVATLKTDMEDDIEDVGEEKKEIAKGANKKGKKSVNVDDEEENQSEEKPAESEDEEDTKKGNRKIKVAPSKHAKGAVKVKTEEKKESTPEKKGSKKGKEAKEDEEMEEEEAPKPKELLKPKPKGKTFLGTKDNKDNKENVEEKKSKEKTDKEKEKEREKSKDKSKEKEKEEESKGSKLDLLKREKKKILPLGKLADKSTDKDKEKEKGKEKEKDKKSDKSKKEASSKKDKKDTDKKDKKKKEKKEKKERKPKKEKEAEDPEEDEAGDDDEEDEDVDESELSKLLDDDEEEEDEFSGDERDIMIYARGADDSSDDVPREEVNEDGEMQMISSKGGRSPVVDTYWKKNLRKSKGSSAKRKADEISNPHAYDQDRVLKMVKTSKKVIMYSGLEQDDVDMLNIAVAKLPGFAVNPTAEPVMTHLIYNGTKRTMKLLYAIAKRAWILAPSFLYSSVEVGDWIAEKDCEFAGVKTKKFRDAIGPLFKDVRFFFNHGDLEYFQTVNIDEIKRLVKLAGGKLTEKAEEAEIIIEDADNRKNSLAPKKFEGNQPHVISYKWILDSLMQYTKLKYQEFEIMM